MGFSGGRVLQLIIIITIIKVSVAWLASACFFSVQGFAGLSSSEHGGQPGQSLSLPW